MYQRMVKMDLSPDVASGPGIGPMFDTESEKRTGLTLISLRGIHGYLDPYWSQTYIIDVPIALFIKHPFHDHVRISADGYSANNALKTIMQIQIYCARREIPRINVNYTSPIKINDIFRIFMFIFIITDSEYFFSNPVYQEDAIEYLTTVPKKEYSRSVSELMDRMGYSYDMIKYRQQLYTEGDKAHNAHDLHTTVVTTGGKGEGTALFYESDMDSMYIVNEVICADNAQRFIHRRNITLFQTERRETSPGYTRLKLLKFDGQYCVEHIKQSLFASETGSLYLSSPFLTDAVRMHKSNTVMQNGAEMGATSGPSASASSKYQNFDNVVSFKCYCPDIVERWISRPRRHGWPSPNTVYEISRLDGHVVPVGYKGSQDMYREWRICYSLAELHFMHNFNETQLKVYILLKKISKSVLNPVCEEMTSYIMKNVVLWICEANGVVGFTLDLLVDRLLDCVKYLKSCVSQNNLPSYMIPERNLLAGRLDTQQRKRLSGLLSDLLHEGGRMLLRCDKLRDAMLVMYKTPDMFREFGEKRDKVESLWLMMRRIRAETNRPGMLQEEHQQRLSHNKQYCDIESHIEHLIQFDGPALRQMGKTYEEINNLWKMRLSELLS